jgi:UDP-N-acetylmuramoyl-tripeptide--D-alanyl-D-alanine ligase
MIKLKLSTAALWMNAKLFGEDHSFQGLCTDSRAVQPGNIFVAIKGENVDGHQFLEQVQASGAVAAIVDHVQDHISLPQLKVDNTVLALGRLAQKYRQSFPIPLAAVTGSCGKTTVKEMLASILSVGGPILASQGNLNTEVGLPLTLLRLSEEKRCGVVEMGARQKGDIQYLMSLAEPDVTTITNAGVAHMEIFGSERGIAEAKGEIFSQLKANGTAVINRDDKYAEYWKSLIKTQKILTFGLVDSEGSSPQLKPNFTCRDLQETSEGCQFELITPTGNRKIFLKAFGKHSVSNALAAAAMAYALGRPIDEIVMGLEKFTPVSGRLQIKSGIAGSKILDDTYNANPVSVKAALAVLANSSTKVNSNSNGNTKDHKNHEKTIFVMGDMLELGPNASQLHREMGEEALRLGIHKMYGIGSLTVEAIKAFGTGAEHFSDKASLIQTLIQDLKTSAQEKDLGNTRILVKGSRGMRMEEIVQALLSSETLDSSREKNPC